MDIQTLLQQSRGWLLDQLGVSGLSESEQQEVVGKLVEHLQKLILETIVVHLNDEQLEVFRKAWEEQGSDLEDVMADLTAQIPGLADKVQAVVNHELDVLKEAYAKVKSV